MVAPWQARRQTDAVLELLGLVSVMTLLHAGVASAVTKRTLPAAPVTLWERLALVSTVAMVVVALALLGLSFAMRHVRINVEPLGAFWVGTLLLEGMGVVALRRASPRLAASAVFVVLLVAPMTMVVKTALRIHDEQTHWSCVHVSRR